MRIAKPPIHDLKRHNLIALARWLIDAATRNDGGRVRAILRLLDWLTSGAE